MLSMELSNKPKEHFASTGYGSSVEQETGPARIRLLLVDDHLLFREGLGRLLVSEPDFDLVAQCTNTEEALRILRQAGADVILIDIALAKDFIPCAGKTRHPGKYLVLASDPDPSGSATVLKLGASGVFLASDSPDRLMRAIRLIAGGEAWIDQKVVQLLADRYPSFEAIWQGQLTAREQCVLRGVMDGLSNKRIGSQIGVSESTIKAAVQQLFRKAGVRTRSQLVRMAMEGSPVNRSATCP